MRGVLRLPKMTKIPAGWVGIEPQSFFNLRQSVGNPAVQHGHVRHGGPGVGVVGVQLQGLGEGGLRFLPSPLISQNGPQNVTAAGIVGIQADRLLRERRRHPTIRIFGLAEMSPGKPTVIGEQTERLGI